MEPPLTTRLAQRACFRVQNCKSLATTIRETKRDDRGSEGHDRNEVVVWGPTAEARVESHSETAAIVVERNGENNSRAGALERGPGVHLDRR
jgi:hypothetical protein